MSKAKLPFDTSTPCVVDVSLQMNAHQIGSDDWRDPHGNQSMNLTIPMSAVASLTELIAKVAPIMAQQANAEFLVNLAKKEAELKAIELEALKAEAVSEVGV